MGHHPSFDRLDTVSSADAYEQVEASSNVEKIQKKFGMGFSAL